MQDSNLRGRIESVEDLSVSVRHLSIRVLNRRRFGFLPGQHLILKIRVDGKDLDRAYSIASAPGDDNAIALCIKRLPKSTVTDFLFSQSVGSELEMEGPFGNFTPRLPPPQNCVFVAAGTGISPIRSMIHAILPQETRHTMLLLFGIREESDILYRTEFESLEKRCPNFRFVPTLSRPGTAWAGCRGYVQDHIRNHVSTRLDPDVYVCGMQSMVREVKSQLMALGLSETRIHFERY